MFNHMVEDSEKVDRVFHALSNRTRRGMVRQLSTGECSVGDLAKPAAMTFAAASKHVKVLEKAGLVIEHEDGYMLARPPDAIRLYDVLRLFQPPRHYYAQAEPDALDQVLNQLDLSDQEQTQSITFASLI